MKTNALRQLEAMGIAFSLREYAWSTDELDAVSVAAKIGLPPEQVFKTLVLTGDAVRYFVCLVPADATIDLKLAARASGNKSAALLPLRELTPLTGYVRGGCSALCMKKALPTYIEETALLFSQIAVSPGVRGAQMLLAPQDLARAASAQFVSLI